MKKLMMLTAFAVPVFLASCGGNQKSAETADSSATPSTETTTETAPEAATNKVEIVANDQMKFDLSEIRVKAGEEVTLTLRNVGTMSKEAMGHNFVLLAPGTDVTAFGNEAMTHKATEYIPAGNKAVIVHTKLLGPSESDTITFTVEKGEYEFICSFPGHYASMRGKLIAE